MNSLFKSFMSMLIAMLGFAFVGPSVGFAQNEEKPSPAKGVYKIGVVDRKRVFDAYDKQKEESAKLKSQVEANQNEIDALSKKVEEAKKDYDANKTTMATDKRERMEQQITSDALKYQADYKRLQTEIDGKYARLIKKMKDEIDAVVQEVGTQEDYHIILEGDPNSPAGVLYYATVIDITSKVIERLNGAAPSSAAKGPAAKPAAPSKKQ